MEQYKLYIHTPRDGDTCSLIPTFLQGLYRSKLCFAPNELTLIYDLVLFLHANLLRKISQPNSLDFIVFKIHPETLRKNVLGMI